MLNSDRTRLQIFDSFQTDRTLPKFNKENKTDSLLTPSWISDGGGSTISVPATSDETNGNNKKSWFKIFIDAVKRFFNAPHKPKLSVQQFFFAIQSELKDVSLYQRKIDDYINTVNYAKQNGQTALYEELQKEVVLIKNEALLLDSGFSTVITEEQVVKFYKESEKALALTYIKNFVRIIPSEVTKLKSEADKLMVFDAYVVLSYDPHGKSFKMTEKERLKKEDPILFGLINGVRKLYFIADWKDEFCDLQLTDFINKFGEEAVHKNNITVNYNKGLK